MAKPSPRLRLKSFRELMTNLHKEILVIHQFIDSYAALYPKRLSEFERMVLVLEDRRFFEHSGVDVKALARILWRRLTFRSSGGASTIDMQLVRVATGRFERTIKRKLREMLLARIIQYRYPKIVILRSYLEIAYFGHHMTGSYNTAQKLYDKNPDDLEGLEAALMACQLVFPRPKAPSSAWETKRLRRANYISAIYFGMEDKFHQIERREFG